MMADMAIDIRISKKNPPFTKEWRVVNAVYRRSYILAKTSVPLVPPKPNEFFNAIFSGALRAVLAQ